MRQMISARLRALLELITMVMMIGGILGMVQPWTILLYSIGFRVLLVGVLVYILVTHLPVKDETPG